MSLLLQPSNLTGQGLLAIALVLVFSPLPSEVLLPAAGMLIAGSGAPLWLPIAAGAIGGGLYSSLGFGMGRYGGRPLILRLGRWVGLDSAASAAADRLIARFGAPGVAASRVIPAIRNAMPLVAGLCAMPFRAFLIASLAGSTVWSALLVLAGYELARGRSWLAPLLHGDPRLLALAAAMAALLLILRLRPWRVVVS